MKADPENMSGPWTMSAWTASYRGQNWQLQLGHGATVVQKDRFQTSSNELCFKMQRTTRLCTYSHSSFKRTSQNVVHWQLGVVAPHLCGTYALGWWDKEAIFCSSSSTSWHILPFEKYPNKEKSTNRKEKATVHFLYLLLNLLVVNPVFSFLTSSGGRSRSSSTSQPPPSSFPIPSSLNPSWASI